MKANRKNAPGAGPPKGNTNASKGLKGGPRITIRGSWPEHALWISVAGDRKLSDWIREKLNLAAAKRRAK